MPRDEIRTGRVPASGGSQTPDASERSRAPLAAILIALILCPGCGRGGHSSQGGPRSKSYRLVGVVREVDPKGGVLTLRHEAIPGYMGAMTMPFPVKGKEALDLLPELRPGDKVEGKLRVEGDAAELVDLEVAEYAPIPPMTLDPSGQLAPKPAVLEPGQAVPDFAMTTQEGEALKLSDLRGKVVVLTFIYTRCPLPNFCPLMDRKFSELAAQVGAVPARADRVRLLSVSFDPEHDTPEVLARHARSRGARPPLWRFAVATHDELRKVAAALGLTYGPTRDEVVHNLSTAVIAPDGTLARLERGGAWTPAALQETIARLLRPGAPGARSERP